MSSPSCQYGVSTSGRTIYKVNSGFTVTCALCGRAMLSPDVFTRGVSGSVMEGREPDSHAPVCRECRPVTFDEVKTREGWRRVAGVGVPDNADFGDGALSPEGGQRKAALCRGRP